MIVVCGPRRGFVVIWGQGGGIEGVKGEQARSVAGGMALIVYFCCDNAYGEVDTIIGVLVLVACVGLSFWRRLMPVIVQACLHLAYATVTTIDSTKTQGVLLLPVGVRFSEAFWMAVQGGCFAVTPTPTTPFASRRGATVNVC